MPIHYARRLTGRKRSATANRHLGYALTFVAGAINAGGFLAVQQYTSHMTGIVTDIGIEPGKLVYWSHSSSSGCGKVMADRERLRLLTLLLQFFFLGGVLGAFGFKHLGYVSTVPLALLLVTLAGVPALDDLRSMGKRMLR